MPAIARSVRGRGFFISRVAKFSSSAYVVRVQKRCRMSRKSHRELQIGRIRFFIASLVTIGLSKIVVKI